MKKSTPEAIKELQGELQDWESELKRLQELAVLSASLSNLKTIELPSIEEKIKALELEIPGLTTESDEVGSGYPSSGTYRLIVGEPIPPGFRATRRSD